MQQIYLNDLLGFQQADYKNIKIKFNQFNGTSDPIEEYQKNPDIVNRQWLFWRNQKRYFSVGQIAICMLKLTQDTWLLTTIKKVTKEKNIYEGVNYEGEELTQFEPYFGRVVIRYHKKSQQQGRYYGEICGELEVQQILPAVFDGDDFPGYDQVRLPYRKLEQILKRGKRDWVAALENQKAVYLICDKSNGKLYVGSATADNGMLLQRWKSYLENGHGGNKELMRVVEEKGFAHIKEYFYYSILENYNAKVDDEVILKRESWWKETLQTRAFGYNGN